MFCYELHDLSFRYPGGTEGRPPALQSVDLGIREHALTLLIGPVGGGKSTIARLLAGQMTGEGGGRWTGRAHFRGQDLLQPRAGPPRVGYVGQEPEFQTLLTVVEDDLIFGMENLGMPRAAMEETLGRICRDLDLEALRRRRIATLSGGERQRVAVAAAMALSRDVLVLDEPAAQLDPWRAEELFALLRRLVDGQGLTVVLLEQRTEGCFERADEIAYVEQGRVLQAGGAGPMAEWLRAHRPEYLPRPAGPVRMGNLAGEAGLACRDLHAGMEAGAPSVTGAYFEAGKGKLMAVVGPNGSGKSTLLLAMAGLIPVERGQALIGGTDPAGWKTRERPRRLAYVSQEPRDHFLCESLEAELELAGHWSGPLSREWIRQVTHNLGVGDLQRRLLRDLSAGEMRLASLAVALAPGAPVWLLDEPTRGVDPAQAERLGRCLTQWAQWREATVVAVTQDWCWAVRWADEIWMMHHGRLVPVPGGLHAATPGRAFAAAMGELK